VKRLNVMYQADLFGRAGLEAMRAAAAPQGIALGAVATFKRNTEEVQEGVRALVQQAGADAIFMVGTYASLASFVQQAMREAGEKLFDSISLEGYLAARVLVEGLRHARAPLTRASLDRGLATLGELDLGGFRVHYGASQRRGSSYLALKTGL